MNNAVNGLSNSIALSTWWNSDGRDGRDGRTVAGRDFGMELSKVALWFTQPLTEMSTRSIKIMFLGSKVTTGAWG
jgi:hypothetical protein